MTGKMDTKKCNNCGITKSASDFYRYKNGAVTTPCKSCRALYSKKIYIKNKKVINKRSRDRKRKLRKTEEGRAYFAAERRRVRGNLQEPSYVTRHMKRQSSSEITPEIVEIKGSRC